MSTSASWFAFGSAFALWTLRRRSRKFRCRDVVFNGPQGDAVARVAGTRAAIALPVPGDEILLLGLDAEWTSRRDLSLLQIASSAHDAILVRLCHGGKLSQDIIDVLERDDIFKFGVNILEDARRVYKSCGVIVRGCVDLRRLSKDAANCNAGMSLASIAAASAIDAVDVSYKSKARCYEQLGCRASIRKSGRIRSKRCHTWTGSGERHRDKGSC